LKGDYYRELTEHFAMTIVADAICERTVRRKQCQETPCSGKNSGIGQLSFSDHSGGNRWRRALQIDTGSAIGIVRQENIPVAPETTEGLNPE